MTTIDLRDCGAVGDGVTLNTEAFAKAFAKAKEEGVGVVTVPPGTYCSGTIVIPSAMTLELQTGATILASPNIEDYPQQDHGGKMPLHLVKSGADRHLILIRDAAHVTIRGGGTIDGNVEAFHGPASERKPYSWTGSKRPRPRPFIEILESQDVRLQDITILNSPGWTCHMCRSDRVWVQGVRMQTYVYSGNSDGFDVDGCRDVMFSDCHIETGDDAIVLKTCKESRSCERVTITNCVMKTSCAAFKIGTETWHDVRHVTVSNCIVYESTRAVEIFSFDGAHVEDIAVSNLSINTNSSINMNRAIHIDLAKRRLGTMDGVDHDAVPLGRIRRVSISNVTVNTDGRILVTGGDGGMIEQIRLHGVSLHQPWTEDPEAVKDLSDQLQSSVAVPEARLARAAVVAANVKDLMLRDLTVTWPEEKVGEDFQPKYEHGELVRDPRKEFEPMPPFHAVWGMNLQGGLIDVPGVRANRDGVEAVKLLDSIAIVRTS